jgi:cytochrome c oxidase subunit 3
VLLPTVEASAIKPAGTAPAGIGASHPDAEVHSHGPVMRTEPHLQDPDLPPNTHLFFGVYFCMTGLHAIHVIVGMFVIGWLIIASIRGRFSSQYYTPVDLGGLYWHIVDLIWIFLFPLFYIIH